LVNGSIRKISPDHSVQQVATIPLPTGAAATGIKVGPDGLVYVASASFAADPSGAFLWRVTPDSVTPGAGAVEQIAALDPSGFPNDLAFDDDGNLFITDPFLGQIWQLDNCGHLSVFLSDPLFQGDATAPAFPNHEFGVDGIAFDHNKKNLYVGVVDFGRIVQIELRGHAAPRLSVLAEDPLLKGVDGIALDRSETIYSAVNTQNRIATVDKHGRVDVVVEGSLLDSPSSFAFGSSNADKHTIFIANFAILNAQAGLPAHPGVLSLPVSTPGLPLP